MRVAGIMSGTSLDGIDVAIVEIAGNADRDPRVSTHALSEGARERDPGVSNARCATAQISRLNFELGELYARAVSRCAERRKIAAKSIELIGCHGQTIYHEGAAIRPTRCRSARRP